VDTKIFVSVGKTSTPEQEDFVRAVEDRLRAEGLMPHTVGRNTFSSDAPLLKVKELMTQCTGAAVIALERKYFPSGVERRGSAAASELRDVVLPTPWNQIEAAMAYCHGHPLLVIVEEGLRDEGLLERGNDWFVQRVRLTPSALSTPEFNGVLASWKDKILNRTSKDKLKGSGDLSQLTLGQLVLGLKPSQLWGLLAALAALIAGSFSLGAKFFVG